MCGICGEIRFDGQDVDAARIAAMTASMHTRGPDDGGQVLHGAHGFGHRRLRVMDMGTASQQPMVDPALGLGIVFNGAVYNYPELRRELAERGYRFFSEGDTEVVLKAYHAWGADCVERFHGMFAFAIWDSSTGFTFLARDRLGIKPLYLSVDERRLRFASSLPALVQAGDVDRSLDPVAVNHYMSFHSVVPPPRTILSGVRKLPPASTMTVARDGQISETRYWQLDYPGAASEERSFDEWRESLLEQLRTAVKRRQLAAVDVGVLLSGGVDSSLLVALMAENGVDRLHTYSVGFESIGDEPGDEFRYSDRIAQEFGTRHQQIRISSEELLRELPAAIGAMSEPMVSHDCIGFFLLSREVSKTCTAVQSGQGADEVFAGYHWYPPLVDAEDPLSAYEKAFFDRDHAEFLSVVGDSFRVGDAAGDFVREHFSRDGAEDPVDKALRLDTTVMLVDDPVKRVDNMTMAWGLEARVPFLDHELVEFAAKIPSRHKLGPQHEGKHVLKEAARAVLPAEVIDRPKGYFPVPALKYLRGSVLEHVRDALNSSRSRERGLLNRRYVDRLLDEPEAHITPLRGSKLWQLGLLELWLQHNGI
ncbi:MAG: N-acetylglutaminylglutamine amidotransferase [Halieaceae bacterium]|jgi:asparagine synthase (glutamine-hydrolysing)|nr:N-acetylglutaminylglutamine amidotransferase [Halieaceae bacterium]